MERIFITPLDEKINEFTSIERSLAFLDAQPRGARSSGPFTYELIVEFFDGDKIRASLTSKTDVRKILEYVATRNN